MHHTTRIKMAVCTGLLAFAGQTAAGVLYYSEDNNANGLFSLNTTTGLATNVGASGVTSNTVGLAPGRTPGTLLGSQFFNMLEMQEDGSGAVNVGSADAEGMAYNAGTDVLYGSINGRFFEISTANFTTTTALADPGSDVEGLAFGRGGVFGLDTDSILKFYDIGTDTWSVVGATGLTTGFNKGLAYDPVGDILYAIDGQTTNLFSLDPTTGASTLIGDTGRSTARGGLAFVPDVDAPEPMTVLLLGAGLLGIGAARRRS